MERGLKWEGLRTGSELEGHTKVTEIVWVKRADAGAERKAAGQRKAVTEMSGLYSRSLYGGSVDR